MTNLENIERRLNNLLKETKENLTKKKCWGRTWDLGYIAALEQMQDIIKQYK